MKRWPVRPAIDVFERASYVVDRTIGGQDTHVRCAHSNVSRDGGRNFEALAPVETVKTGLKIFPAYANTPDQLARRPVE